MKQIIHSFLYGSAVWAACTVSQEVKAGGIPVSTTEDGDAISPNIVCVVCEDIGPWLHCFGDSVAVQAFWVGYKKSEIVDFLIEH